MSFIEDNDLHAQYYIDCMDRRKAAIEMSDRDLAETLIEQQEHIDEKFKAIVLNISAKVIKGDYVSDKQKNVLINAYVNNFEIDRE